MCCGSAQFHIHVFLQIKLCMFMSICFQDSPTAPPTYATPGVRPPCGTALLGYGTPGARHSWGTASALNMTVA